VAVGSPSLLASLRGTPTAPFFFQPGATFRHPTFVIDATALSALPFATPLPRVSQDVALAQAGDELAFRRLYDGHVGRVYALCLRLEGDAARAEELTQDCFVRAWDRLTTFRGESAFGTWLHRLAVNVVLSDRRSAWRRSKYEIVHETPEELPVATREAPAGLAMDLERVIAELPPGARTILTLHDIEGYRHDEIATLTGVTVGTSKAQLFRARRLLREALDR
jgi:RNA polymerase sigma-70 factor (ECF subfamily)